MTGIKLDAIRQLRVLAAGISGAHVSEQILDAQFGDVWAALTDFTGGFMEVQPDMRRVDVLGVRGEAVELLARSRFGMRAHFFGVLRPGWCLLQSRFLLVAMAAAAEPGGGTRVAFTGGVRIPGRPALVPVGVKREGQRSLRRLATLLQSG